MAATATNEPASSTPPASSSGPQEPLEAEKIEWAGTTPAQCERMIHYARRRNPTVKFMLDKLEEAGCSVGERFIRVEHCDMDVGGGFRAQDGVVICHNHLAAQEEINNALSHELIHAYDHCRAQNLDWTDCEHHACSEIRAASLSGDCKWRLEAMRGHFALRGQHQKCVRRRAELSVGMNPYCGGAKAAQAVDKVFEKCFADTAPFDRRP